MAGFFEIIRIMIAISCVLCIVGMMMPAKKSPAISMIIGIIVIVGVLSPFVGGEGLQLREFDSLSFEVEAKNYGNLLKEQTIEITKKQMQEDIKERCVKLTGNLPEEVLIDAEVQEDVLHIRTITITLKEEGYAQRLEEIEAAYQPDEMIIKQVKQ